jgi:hypothetical protein
MIFYHKNGVFTDSQRILTKGKSTESWNPEFRFIP